MKDSTELLDYAGVLIKKAEFMKALHESGYETDSLHYSRDIFFKKEELICRTEPASLFQKGIGARLTYRMNSLYFFYENLSSLTQAEELIQTFSSLRDKSPIKIKNHISLFYDGSIFYILPISEYGYLGEENFDVEMSIFMTKDELMYSAKVIYFSVNDIEISDFDVIELLLKQEIISCKKQYKKKIRNYFDELELQKAKESGKILSSLNKFERSEKTDRLFRI